MLARRLVQMWATMVIGDGIVALLEPRRHAELWRGGPPVYREVIEWCHRHPNGTRAIGLAWSGFGLWLAIRQLPSPEECQRSADPPLPRSDSPRT